MRAGAPAVHARAPRPPRPRAAGRGAAAAGRRPPPPTKHADHCDNVFLTGLAAETDCRFVGPPAVGVLLAAWDVPEARVTIVAPGARITLPAGEVEAVKAVHVSGAVGYVVRLTDGPTLYFAGDTGLFLGMQALGAAGVDAAFLPINAQYDNLGIDGAVTALAWVRAAARGSDPLRDVRRQHGAAGATRGARRGGRARDVRVVVPGHGEEVVIDARG